MKSVRASMLHALVLMVAASSGVRAAEKNWSAPTHKIYAQALSDRIIKEHPELVSVTFHGVPPGMKDAYTMYAGSFPERIGNVDDPDDIDVTKKGITIVDPRWHRNDDPKKFVVLMPLRDARDENIGLIVYAFKNPVVHADDERKFFGDSLTMRDALRSQIPSYEALFAPASE